MKELRLASISKHLSADDRSPWNRLFPSLLEKILLGFAVLGCALVVVCVFAVKWSYRSEVGVVAGIMVVVASLLLMLTTIFRDLATFVKELKRPLSAIDDAYERTYWVVHALSDYPVDRLISMRNFIRHREEEIRNRIGFFAGSLEVVGIVPLLLAGWWAWRSASSPMEFSFPEQYCFHSLLVFMLGFCLSDLSCLPLQEWGMYWMSQFA